MVPIYDAWSRRHYWWHWLCDETVECLIKQALSHAEAGWLHQVTWWMAVLAQFVRLQWPYLYQHHGLLCKICIYGPFRDAVGSASNLKGGNTTRWTLPTVPKRYMKSRLRRRRHGDCKTGHAISGCKVKDTFGVPTFIYQVSGEC